MMNPRKLMVIGELFERTIGNATERAYRRGDLFEKRRREMGD